MPKSVHFCLLSSLAFSRAFFQHSQEHENIMMVFWCQSCGEQHTSPHVAQANITTCAKCGGQSFATWQPNRQSLGWGKEEKEMMHPALVKLMNLAHEFWDDGMEQSNKIIVDCCKELDLALSQESVRSEALEAVAKMADDWSKNDHDDFHEFAGRIRALSPARMAEGGPSGESGMDHLAKALNPFAN